MTRGPLPLGPQHELCKNAARGLGILCTGLRYARKNLRAAGFPLAWWLHLCGSLFFLTACVNGGGEVAETTKPPEDASSDVSKDGLLFDVDDLPDEGCGSACPPGQTCSKGACICPTTGDAPATLCGASCVDLSGDPLNCGACGVKCNDDQYCRLLAGPNCKCRPPAVACTGTCRDRSSDPNACGDCGTVCPSSAPACAKGSCAALCPAGLTGCPSGGKVACVDTTSNPGHCGKCGTVCATDELCVAGACVHYRPAVGCVTCPCAVCAGIFAKPWSCCPPLPGHKSSLCVAATACPT